MSAKTKTPVMIAPMPTDRRVVALGRAMGTTTRAAWAMAAESWAWLAAEAGDDGVVPGDATLLDAVADVEGLGVAMIAAGLVGVTADGLVLPAELVATSRLLEGGGDVARDDRRRQKAAERSRKYRRRNRLSGSTTTTPSPSTASSGGGQQAVPSRRPRRLGMACGHVVMLLDGRYGSFVQLNGAEPKLTATAEGMDYETLTIADALELLVPMHRAHPAPGGRHRVPKLADLEAAARLERDRQRSVDAAAAAVTDTDHRALGDGALLEAAADIEDDGEQRDGDGRVTLRTHTQRDGHAPRHAVAEAGSVTSPSVGGDLGDVSRHAPRHAHGAASTANSSSSSSLSFSDQRKTTTTTAQVSGRAFERDATATEPVPAWLVEERARMEQARLEGFAVGLGVTVDEIHRMFATDRKDLRRRLEVAGVDPKTGRPLRGRDVPARPTRPTGPVSIAQAAGVRLPDLSVDRQRGLGDRAAVNEPVQDDQSDAQATDDIVFTDEAADEIHHERDVDESVDVGVKADLDVDDIRESVDEGLDEAADLGLDAAEDDAALDDDAGAHEPVDASPESATADTAS